MTDEKLFLDIDYIYESFITIWIQWAILHDFQDESVNQTHTQGPD